MGDYNNDMILLNFNVAVITMSTRQGFCFEVPNKKKIVAIYVGDSLHLAQEIRALIVNF